MLFGKTGLRSNFYLAARELPNIRILKIAKHSNVKVRIKFAAGAGQLDCPPFLLSRLIVNPANWPVIAYTRVFGLQFAKSIIGNRLNLFGDRNFYGLFETAMSLEIFHQSYITETKMLRTPFRRTSNQDHSRGEQDASWTVKRSRAFNARRIRECAPRDPKTHGRAGNNCSSMPRFMDFRLVSSRSSRRGFVQIVNFGGKPQALENLPNFVSAIETQCSGPKRKPALSVFDGLLHQSPANIANLRCLCLKSAFFSEAQ